MSDREISEEDLKNMSAEEIAELQKKNCVFCKIASKEIPAKILHEDTDIICVLDINPISEGHILVFPKEHYMIMPHIPDNILSKLFDTVKLMSNTLLKSLQCRGTSVFIANGAAAGQKAPHVLVHVFPRRENDGLMELPKYSLNSEESSSLNKKLSPYLKKIFGSNFRESPKESSREKTSAASESNEEHIKEHRKNVDEFEKEIHDIKDEVKEITPEKPKKTVVKKNPEKKSESKADSDKKLDLNDIAKLFGG